MWQHQEIRARWATLRDTVCYTTLNGGGGIERRTNAVTDQAKPDPILSPSDITALTTLIECIEQTTPLHQEAILSLRNKRNYLLRLMASVENVEISSGRGSSTSDQPEFNPDVRKIEGGLGEQVAFVSKVFSNYLELGIAPSGPCTWETAELLRRANQKDLEKRFLAAWRRHFPDGAGQPDSDLNQLRKALMNWS